MEIMETVGKIIEGFGEKWVKGERWGQGYVYKNFQAFNDKLDEVCYINEYGFPVENAETIEVLNLETNERETYYKLDQCDKYTYYSFYYIIKEEFPDLSETEIEKRASILFDMVDWQIPYSLLYELEFEDFEDKEESNE